MPHSFIAVRCFFAFLSKKGFLTQKGFPEGRLPCTKGAFFGTALPSPAATPPLIGDAEKNPLVFYRIDRINRRLPSIKNR